MSGADRETLDPGRTTIEQRLVAHLDGVVSSSELPPSHPNRARRAARRRTVRRRRRVVAGVALASVVAIVGGIWRLSQPDTSSIRTVETPEIDGESVSVDDQEPTVADDGGPDPAIGGVDDASSDGFDVAAEVESPAFVWKVVEPDAGAAVSGTFDHGPPVGFPGYVLSTPPGRSNDYDNIELVVWQTDDGISFEQTSLSSPFETTLDQPFWQPVFADGPIYAVGTAAAVPATDANPLQVAVSGDASGDWRLVDLPYDTHTTVEAPFAETNLSIARFPIGDDLFVAVTQEVFIDLSRLLAEQSMDPSEFLVVGETATGVTTIEPTCPTLAGPFAGNAPTEPALDCETTEYTWAELGVPPETAAARDARTTRFFLVDSALSVTEVDGPIPGAMATWGSGSPVFTAIEDRRSGPVAPLGDVEVYEFDGAGWTSTVIPAISWHHDPVEVAGLVGGFANTSGGVGFTTADGDGATTSASLDPVIGTDVLVDAWQRPVVADDRAVAAIGVWPDSIAAAGGVEYTIDGVTARRSAASAPIEYVDATTGATIDSSLVVFDRTTGATSVLDETGGVRARFTAQRLYERLDPGVQGAAADARETLLVTTADGRHFSAESVAELLEAGLGREAPVVTNVSRISTDGTTVVVALNTDERHPDGSRKQFVLVGTPVD